jgi:hypothetical protein
MRLFKRYSIFVFVICHSILYFNFHVYDYDLDYFYLVYGFDSEEDLLKYHENNPKSVRAGIFFKNAASGIPNNVEYTLRVARKEVSDRWFTKNVYSFFQVTGPRDNKTTGGNPG